MKKPEITIIVPVFNVEKYISECIESILKQTYKNIQIILVDDGSSDQSGNICDYLSSFDQRIEVIHQSNKGLVSARKQGLKKARGKYIGFVDGDDFIFPDMYQKLVETIELTNADFVHAGYWLNNLQKSSFHDEVLDLAIVREDYLKNLLMGEGITASIWSKLFKSDLIKKCYYQLPEEGSFGEDILNLCLCLFESNKLALVNGAYYSYRIREDSLSNKTDISVLIKVFELYKNLCNIFSSYGCYEYWANLLNEFLWNNLLTYMVKIKHNDFLISRYYFDNLDKLFRKKIVIYGAGKVGKDYYAQISRYTDCTIVAWIDLHPEEYNYPHITLYNLDVLDTISFDFLLIAVWNEYMAKEIYLNLLKRGIDKKKIHWSKPKEYSFN